MLLKDAIIVWTPNGRDGAYPSLKGKIAITNVAEEHKWLRHSCSVGANSPYWRDTNHEGRIKLLEEAMSRMVLIQGLSEHIVREIVGHIEDIDIEQVRVSEDLL